MASKNRSNDRYELVKLRDPNNDHNFPYIDDQNEKALSRIESFELEAKEPKREKWANVVEFFLSCIGYAVGLGNIWRFPYLCYNNGGGAFLVPYCISLILCGVPMFVLETSWGQLLSIGGLGMWKLCPILKGVGIAAVVVAFWLNIYYIVVLAWAIYYFYHSFTLPWSRCKNAWNTVQCRSEYEKCTNLSAALAVGNVTLKDLNLTDYSQVFSADWIYNASYKFCEIVSNYSSPVREFWENEALSVTDSIEKPGILKWDLALCLFIAWVLCYLAIFKGVGWTGKVVYFTAIFPYILLVILFFRGITLPGAAKGLKYYMYPQLELLADAEVWKKAFTQIFFTYGLALGALVALGSYNKYHNNIVKQAFSICLIDSGTSVFAGFAVFSFIGYMSEMQDQRVEDVAKSGPGLLFLVYPSGIMSLDYAGFWSVLFFFMVILIGIDSQFCTMEGFYTAIIDEWPKYLRKSPNREIFIAIFSGISFLIGLSMVTEGGIWVFQILDDYGASSWCLLWLLFFECIAISWLYGVDKWYVHLKDMIGYQPSMWWKFCWVYACPFCCTGIFIFSLIDYQGTTYNGASVPAWADGMGWLIALSSMLCIPIYAVWLWCRTPGSFNQKYKAIVCPDIDVTELREHALKNEEKSFLLLLIRHILRYYSRMWFYIVCLVLAAKVFEGQATLRATAYLQKSGIGTKAEKYRIEPIAVGIVNFTQEGKGQPVTVTVDLVSWPPESDPTLSYNNYGFHVHEMGNLGQNCMLAGNHFNPRNVTHGYPNDTIRHVGDLGNLLHVANMVLTPEGFFRLQLNDSTIDLTPGPQSIIGRSIVLHAKMDDGGRGANNSETLTTGNAGARFACGVIAISSDFSSVAAYNGGVRGLQVRQSAAVAWAALTPVLTAFLWSR